MFLNEFEFINIFWLFILCLLFKKFVKEYEWVKDILLFLEGVFEFIVLKLVLLLKNKFLLFCVLKRLLEEKDFLSIGLVKLLSFWILL